MLRNSKLNRMERMFLLIVIFAIFSTPAYSDTLAWWRFEEGSDGQVLTGEIKDWGEDGLSEGQLTGGSPHGDPIYGLTDHNLDVNGLSDQLALQFDGIDDFIDQIPAVGFNMFSTFSVEAIINWGGIMENPPEGDRGVNMILQQSDGEQTGRSWLFIQESDLTLRSYIGGAGTIMEGMEVPANQWIYVGVTYDDGFVVLWMDTDLSDGIQPETNTFTGFQDFEDNEAPLIIGMHKNLADHFYGKISELRITDSGLGEGPLPENPPADHLQVSPAASIHEWDLY